jgi:hypothetical protein
MILTGRLADWSVEQLLQIMRITEKTGSMEIETVGADVVLYFVDGALVDASMRGRFGAGDPQIRVVEAVAAVMNAPDGSFDIGNEMSTNPGDPLPVPDLLSAVGIWQVAEDELAATGVLDAAAIRLIHETSRPLEFEPEAWLAVAEFAGHMTFTELEIRLGRIGAIEVVRTLREMGVLEMAAGAPPAECPPADPATAEFDEGEFDRPFAEPIDESLWHEAIREEEPLPDPPAAPPDTDSDREPVVHGSVEEYRYERRREMRSVITPAETTLVPGVLSDIRTRFRQ